MGHPQPPTPMQTDNRNALGVVNSNIQTGQTKAMDMPSTCSGTGKHKKTKFYWIPDKTNSFFDCCLHTHSTYRLLTAAPLFLSCLGHRRPTAPQYVIHASPIIPRQVVYLPTPIFRLASPRRDLLPPCLLAAIPNRAQGIVLRRTSAQRLATDLNLDNTRRCVVTMACCASLLPLCELKRVFFPGNQK
jgi:hypothetical protein